MDSRTYKPVSVAHPGETVLEYLESFGWSQRDLSRRTGLTTKTISEICNGKAPISTPTSIALEKVFRRPAHFWINLQSRYDECEARKMEAARSLDWADWYKSFPVKELRKRGWIRKGTTESEVSDLLKFLGVSSPDSWDAVWQSSKVAYRQTRKFTKNDYAVSAWVRRIELLADEIETLPYDEMVLRNSLEEIRHCTRLDIAQSLGVVQEILQKSGVAFVVEPALPQTGISGCTRWVTSKKVIVALSLRFKSDDQIWFTLLHEIGHVLYHRKQHTFILDNDDESLTDGIVDPEMQKFEDEANRFAADTLIPPAVLKKFISFGIFENEYIHEFSEVIGIAPGIVVGRLQHEGLLKPWQGNKLKQSVNWQFITSEE